MKTKIIILLTMLLITTSLIGCATNEVDDATNELITTMTPEIIITDNNIVKTDAIVTNDSEDIIDDNINIDDSEEFIGGVDDYYENTEDDSDAMTYEDEFINYDTNHPFIDGIMGDSDWFTLLTVDEAKEFITKTKLTDYTEWCDIYGNESDEFYLFCEDIIFILYDGYTYLIYFTMCDGVYCCEVYEDEILSTRAGYPVYILNYFMEEYGTGMLVSVDGLDPFIEDITENGLYEMYFGSPEDAAVEASNFLQARIKEEYNNKVFMLTDNSTYVVCTEWTLIEPESYSVGGNTFVYSSKYRCDLHSPYQVTALATANCTATVTYEYNGSGINVLSYELSFSNGY